MALLFCCNVILYQCPIVFYGIAILNVPTICDCDSIVLWDFHTMVL